jgi:lipopolysaccharide heptosyltransferase III
LETALPSEIALPARPNILVITLRRLGDVLMSTPLIRTLRRRWPGGTVDALVFAGSDRMLKGNPDLDNVITVPPRPSFAQTLALAKRIGRRYDLAVSTQSGDRPIFYAVLASRRRVSLVPTSGGGTWWKRRVLERTLSLDRDTHRLEEMRALANALGLSLLPDSVCPQGGSAAPVAPEVPYAVLHATPFESYRRWNVEGWRGLARGLTERGLKVVATEGRDPIERAYVESVFGPLDVVRERGQLDWPGLAALLKDAAVYVGPDTSMTHLAAASGCPTVALHGSTNPQRTAAWPVGGFSEMWERTGTIQNRGNVWVVQNPLPCLPCEKLGCENRLDSYSRCLDELSAERVLIAVDRALAQARRRGEPSLPNAAREAIP